MKTHNKPLEHKISSCADVSTRTNRETHHVSVFMTTNIPVESRPHWNPNNNILAIIFWTIGGLTVSDHHFDPLPKQEPPPSWARHTFILPLTQTEHVCCSFHCCSSLTNTQPSVHLSPVLEHCWGQRTGHFVSVTETDYIRENSLLLTESLIPFPNRIVLIPDESHNCSALNKNFLTVTGGKMWTGFFWSITLVFIGDASHQSPKTCKTDTSEISFLIYFEDKLTFDFQLSDITIVINTITWSEEKSQFNVKSDLVFAEILSCLEYTSFIISSLFSRSNNNKLIFHFLHW